MEEQTVALPNNQLEARRICSVCSEPDPTDEHLASHNQPVEVGIRDDLVRSAETGDRVFLVKNNETHWIKSPEILAALGAAIGQERSLTKEEFSKFTKGEEITMENVERYK